MTVALRLTAPGAPPARKALAVAQWTFVSLIVLQVYLAGVFLMWDGEALDAHRALGWLLTYVPFLTLVLAFPAKMPPRFWVSFGVMFAAIHAQPFLALVPADDGLGWVRALHPVNAMLVLGLAFQQARLTRTALPTPTGATP